MRNVVKFMSNVIFIFILFFIISLFIYKYANTFSLSEIGTGKIHCDLNENLRTCRFTPVDTASLSAGVNTYTSYIINYNEIDEKNKIYIGSNCSNLNLSSDGICTFSVFGEIDKKNHSIKSIKIKMPE